MTGQTLPTPVADRLGRVARMETRLAQGLTVAGDDEVAQQLERMRSLAERHGEALTELRERRGVPAAATSPESGLSADSPAGLLQEATTAAAAAATAYAALYATARLLFEGSVCEVASRHGSEWVAELGNASELVPVAVVHELVAGGDECRCVCPAYGIGACLCMRNSIETVRTQWGRPELEASDGIELRIPPRTGSQLADAGLGQGDRILSIDGDVVRNNRELQQALRGGAIGEARTALVLQRGSQREIPIARVSDLP